MNRLWSRTRDCRCFVPHLRHWLCGSKIHFIRKKFTLHTQNVHYFATQLFLWYNCTVTKVSTTIATSTNTFHYHFQWVWLTVKVKFSRYRPGVAQRVGRRIAVLFHDCSTIRRWVVSSMPWLHFIPRKDPLPIVQEAGWASGLVWTGGKSHPHQDSILDCPAHSQSLYQLNYRPTWLTELNVLWNPVCLSTVHLCTCFSSQATLDRFWICTKQKICCRR